MATLPIICNLHFVCLDCRRSIKCFAPYVWNGDGVRPRQIILTEKVICPKCRGEMICVGKKFTTPRKADDAAWKKLQWLIENGWRGSDWPVSPRMTLLELRQSLSDEKLKIEKAAHEQKQSESFEEKRRVARKRLKAKLKRQQEYQKAVLGAVANNSASLTSTDPTP